MKLYYTVFAGKQTGVFQTWDECKAQVMGYKGAAYKSYNTREEAEEAYKNLDNILKLSQKVGKNKVIKEVSKYMPKMVDNKLSDGYRIKLPFKLNDQQIKVLGEINEFIESKNEKTMTISGWAGTGKTTLMEIVANRYSYQYKIFFAATTHKAAGVLKTKVGKNVSTVNSLFGINVEVNMDGEYYDSTDKKNVKGSDKLSNNSIVIIDEASMLSESNYSEVLSICDSYRSKVIFIGDSAQLSPVKETDISIVFRDKQARIVELTKVERTNDNSILNEATNIRINGQYTYESGDNVKYINGNDSNSIKDVFDKYISGLKDNPNYFRVLTYTNKNVEKLNRAIRLKLGYEDNLIPQEGEPLMAYANWGYIGGRPTARYKVVNSEAYTCGGIVETRNVDVFDMLSSKPYGTKYASGVFLHINYMKLIDGLGDSIEVPFVDVKNDMDNRAVVRLLAYEKVYQWSLYRRTSNKIEKMKILEKINAIDDLLFVNEHIVSDDGYRLLDKAIDFGYAHTIHKSQGSTFDNVLINDIDIDNCLDKDIKKQLRYVAITRASKSVNIITNKI